LESYHLIAAAGLASGVLSAMVLLLFPRSRNTANRFLGISVLFLTHNLLMSLLNTTGWILEVPLLIRTGNITIYLLIPFLYLFYRGVFKSEKDWKPTYYLFFIPSLIYLIDYIPFFTLPVDQKTEVFSGTLTNPSELIKVNEGLFGWTYFHFTFRTLWSAFFLYLIGKILLDFRLDFRRNSAFSDVFFYSRLVALWGIIVVLLLLPALGFLFFKFKEYTQIFMMISMAVTLFLITMSLLFSPRLLYGYYWVFNDEEIQPPVPVESNPDIDDSAELRLLEHLTEVVKERSLFEKIGYTIHNLAQETAMPSYRISYIINKHTGKNFSNWINSFRVQKFLTLIEKGDTMKYTLDSIAPDCGFSSRSTLNTAFKKEMGTSPGRYLKTRNSRQG
jgi:AraC-like DNA-binding protein